MPELMPWCVWMALLQGFLPEAADQFAQDVVYPAFSPTLAVFLVCSTAYGLWKVMRGPQHLRFVHYETSTSGHQILMWWHCRANRGRPEAPLSCCNHANA